MSGGNNRSESQHSIVLLWDIRLLYSLDIEEMRKIRQVCIELYYYTEDAGYRYEIWQEAYLVEERA